MKKIIFAIGLTLSLNTTTQDAFSMSESSLTSSRDAFSMSASSLTSSGDECDTSIYSAPIRANASPIIASQAYSSLTSPDSTATTPSLSDLSSTDMESEWGSSFLFSDSSSMSLSSVETPSILAISIPDDASVRCVWGLQKPLQRQFDYATDLRAELKNACYNLFKEKITAGRNLYDSPDHALLYEALQSCIELQDVLRTQMNEEDVDSITLGTIDKIGELVRNIQMFSEFHGSLISPKARELSDLLDNLM